MMIYYRHKKTKEVFAYEQSDIDKVNKINSGDTDGIDPVFFKIRDNLANCTLMTDEEVEEHINPTPTTEQPEAQARAKRDGLLRELDAIVTNPLRWSTFDDTQKQALADYRQALLDVPQQDGFPENINWPIKPEVI